MPYIMVTELSDQEGDLIKDEQSALGEGREWGLMRKFGGTRTNVVLRPIVVMAWQQTDHSPATLLDITGLAGLQCTTHRVKLLRLHKH